MQSDLISNNLDLMRAFKYHDINFIKEYINDNNITSELLSYVLELGNAEIVQIIFQNFEKNKKIHTLFQPNINNKNIISILEDLRRRCLDSVIKDNDNVNDIVKMLQYHHILVKVLPNFRKGIDWYRLTDAQNWKDKRLADDFRILLKKNLLFKALYSITIVLINNLNILSPIEENLLPLKNALGKIVDVDLKFNDKNFDEIFNAISLALNYLKNIKITYNFKSFIFGLEKILIFKEYKIVFISETLETSQKKEKPFIVSKEDKNNQEKNKISFRI